MTYFQQLSGDVRDEIFDVLTRKVIEDKDHQLNAEDAKMSLDDYAKETVDDWINTHNFNLSISEWIKQIQEADI